MTRGRDLEVSLREALAPIAADAPMPTDVLDVPGGSIRSRAAPATIRPAAAIMVVLAAVLVTIGALSALDALPWQRTGDPVLITPDLQSLDVTPRVLPNPELVGFDPGQASGPVVQAATGTAYGSPFRLLAYQSGGHCLWFSYRDVLGGGGCSGLPQDDEGGGPDLGMALADRTPSLPGYVYGLLRPGVDRAWVDGVEGDRVAAEVIPLDLAGIDAQAYLAFFPAEFAPARIVLTDAAGTAIAAYDIEALMEIPPLGGGGPSRVPSIDLVVRNHTDAAVEGRLEDEGPSSTGSGTAEVPGCEIGWLSSGWFPGVAYRGSVNGVLVHESVRDPVEVPSGHALEVLVDVRPGAEPTVTSIELRTIEESVSRSTSDGRGTWTGRAAEIADGLDCGAPPDGP
jgi:hypothetical protein